MPVDQFGPKSHHPVLVQGRGAGGDQGPLLQHLSQGRLGATGALGDLLDGLEHARPALGQFAHHEIPIQVPGLVPGDTDLVQPQLRVDVDHRSAGHVDHATHHVSLELAAVAGDAGDLVAADDGEASRDGDGVDLAPVADAADLPREDQSGLPPAAVHVLVDQHVEGDGGVEEVAGLHEGVVAGILGVGVGHQAAVVGGDQ